MGIVAARAQITYSLIVNSQLLSNSNCYSSSRHDINRVMLLHVSFVPVPLVCVSFFSVRRCSCSYRVQGWFDTSHSPGQYASSLKFAIWSCAALQSLQLSRATFLVTYVPISGVVFTANRPDPESVCVDGRRRLTTSTSASSVSKNCLLPRSVLLF